MEENLNYNVSEDDSNKEKVSFSDKVIGIFVSPNETLTMLSKRQAKASDWVIPLVIMVIVVGISNLVYFYSPNLKVQLQEKQFEAIDKSVNERVKQGELSPEHAKTQIETAKKQIENFGIIGLIFQVIGTAIFLFINFLIVNGVFYLLIKYILKGEGNFNLAMSAYGSVYYVLILQAIFALLLTLLMDKFVTGLNYFSFTEVEMMSLEGFIYRKIDLFLIWFYALLGMSYAKFFRATDIKRYIILVFAVWIITNVLFYYLSTVSIYFQGLAM